jgi:hypothetical protein
VFLASVTIAHYGVWQSNDRDTFAMFLCDVETANPIIIVSNDIKLK